MCLETPSFGTLEWNVISENSTKCSFPVNTCDKIIVFTTTFYV